MTKIGLKASRESTKARYHKLGVTSMRPVGNIDYVLQNTQQQLCEWREVY